MPIDVDEQTEKEYWTSNAAEDIIKFATDPTVDDVQDSRLILKILVEKGFYIPGCISKMSTKEADNAWKCAQLEILDKARQYNPVYYRQMIANKHNSTFIR